jgi:signal peptidase
VIVLLLLSFLLVNFVLAKIRPPGLNLYILQPILWLSLAALSYWFWRRENPASSIPIDKGLIATAALIGLFQVAVFILFGLFSGFGNSPYAHRIDRALLNFWYFSTLLIGLEVCRWYLATNLSRHNVWLGFGLSWILITLASLPVAAYIQLDEMGKTFRFTGRLLLPKASDNLLATYMVVVGGPFVSLSYYAPLTLFEWFSPILPDLNWPTTAFLGTLVPVFGMFAVNELIRWRSTNIEQPAERNSRGYSGWLLFALTAIGLIWLNTGLFGIQPSLISGPSMRPTLLPGDIVITRAVPSEAIQIGDVIRFRQGGIDIVHRVVDIQRNGGTVGFITKGDYNNTTDPFVPAGDVKGKVIFSIPKIGWVAIIFRQAIAWVF